MNLRHRLDAGEIQCLYVDEGWTTAQLAAHFHCAATTIIRRLDDLGIARRSRGRHVTRNQDFSWSPELAYVVGLIATDGNLSKDSRHIMLVSKDIDLLETVRACLRLKNIIAIHHGSWGTAAYHLQWGNRSFYKWLNRIGLMSAKSLRLGPLLIPDEFLADFVRGCVDGDGTIVTYVDRHHTAKNEKYVYERLFVSVVSASLPFLEWLQTSVGRVAHVKGALLLHKDSKANRSSIWALKYAKRESARLLNWMYYAPTVPCLARKRRIAQPFLMWK